MRSRAKEAERAVEAACPQRFGTLRPAGAPVLRSDNGLIFQSRRFRQACRDYRLQQEFITPYTPEQNGIIERFFRSLKEECVWQHRFQTFEVLRPTISLDTPLGHTALSLNGGVYGEIQDGARPVFLAEEDGGRVARVTRRRSGSGLA
ncbi:MAG: integrase core domain-containing protein [Nitrospira sp.]